MRPMQKAGVALVTCVLAAVVFYGCEQGSPASPTKRLLTSGLAVFNQAPVPVLSGQ